MATSTKAALREQLLLARRDVADDVRAAEARMLGEHAELVVSGDSTVCAYVPVGTEPGSIEMLDMLLRRAKRVLLPVARTAADGTPHAAAVGRVPAGRTRRADRGACSSRPSPGCPSRPWPRPAW